MSLNEDVRVVHIGSVGVNGTGITAPEKLQITSDLAELQELVMPPTGVIAAGKYYGPLSTLAGGTAAGQYDRWQSANRLHAAPFICPVDATFDQIGVQLPTAAASGAIRMGVYAAGDDGLPSTLIADYGTVSLTSSGFRFIPVNQVLGRGLYWLAGASDTDVIVRADQSQGMHAFGGHNTPFGETPIVAVYQLDLLSSGFTSLPATFGGVIAEPGVPFYWLRAA